MSLDEWVQPVVDPEVRAFVTSLISAVGGSSLEEDGRYVLGDDALACLKDILRWIRLHDDRLKRYDVQRCIAESNLVEGDLLEILAQSPADAALEKLRHRVALACIEVLVPLTWPIEIPRSEMTVNHHRHIPYLRIAQASYKRAILQSYSTKYLQTVVRIALPSIAQPRSERTPKDEGIIKIILYFLRNIAAIGQSKRSAVDGEDSEVSRSATLEAFHEQDIFQLLLTIASSIGDEFTVQDVIILDILYSLLKGIDPEKLFMDEHSVTHANTAEFKSLLNKEKAMHAGYARHAPTRHNRFGTMIWVKREDDKVSTVTGQDVLGSAQRSLQKMDKTKKWNKPKYRGRVDDKPTDDMDKEVQLTSTARRHLQTFVEEFIDSSFNPLFIHLRKSISRESDRIESSNHPRQYFYLISWFLQAQRARINKMKSKGISTQVEGASSADDNFAIVAGVMTQETFIQLNRYLQTAEDEKTWADLNAGMQCFTQILLTVQEMAESTLEDDQEIAENIQNRIFYEETTHDRVVTLLRTYKGQGFGYLNACTELAHVFVRMLERYSKQNLDLQVRSRRRAQRKKKKKQATEARKDDDEPGLEDNAVNSEEEEVAEAQRRTTERKFDFTRFSSRFLQQGCVDTFVALTRYYSDLTPEQLKRAHRYFYRLVFKMELGIFLYRADILLLFNNMIKGPNSLNKDLPIFKDWEELIRQIFKRVVKKTQDRPELVVEILFSKIPATTFYLENGYEREISVKTPRAPAELEMKPGLTKNEEIGIVVAILLNQGKSDDVKWITDVMQSAATDRKAWEDSEAARKEVSGESNEAETSSSIGAEAIVIKPGSDERRTALYKDNKLRLLLEVLGLLRLVDEANDVDSLWCIPSKMTSIEILEKIDSIQKAEFDPPSYEEQGKALEDFVQRTSVHQPKVNEDGMEVDSDSLGDEELFFPAGGPTSRKGDALEELKSKRRRRRKSTGEIDDEERERRAEARRKADAEKNRRIKSELYVHDSDDETDEERDRDFFAKEEKRRLAAGSKIKKALMTGQSVEDISNKRKLDEDTKLTRKRRRGKAELSDEDEATPLYGDSSRSSSIEPRTIQVDSSDDEGTDTPLSSQQQNLLQKEHDDVESSDSAGSISKKMARNAVLSDDDDDFPVAKPVRRAVRAGFVIESDSE